jgi:hypothetical protein
MVILVGASALMLAGLQASTTAATTSFRGCLHETVAKATSEKVSADTIETYLRDACTVQMGSLKQALVDFGIKNGMSRREAASDAQMTIDNYVSTPVDNYKFIAKQDTPQSAPAAAQATPVVTPAAQPTSSQPHN